MRKLSSRFLKHIVFERCCLEKRYWMSRVKSRNAHLHVSDFDKGRMVAYRYCDLSYHSIASRVGRDPMTVSRILNPWFQDGNTERCAGISTRSPITNRREDRHVTRMALMDRSVMSRALSQGLGSFARKQVSARTF
ncbi:HTH_Tnp_Tc3_2 domain-containing protein [Trichonephila clavipes]|nr:HTH_Tnp_Tc3_2 domain-containing protein [Trichonephila clavipes]